MTNSEAYRNIVFRNIGMIKNVCLGILQVEKDIEIMLDYENDKVVSLGDLTPNWWIE